MAKARDLDLMAEYKKYTRCILLSDAPALEVDCTTAALSNASAQGDSDSRHSCHGQLPRGGLPHKVAPLVIEQDPRTRSSRCAQPRPQAAVPQGRVHCVVHYAHQPRVPVDSLSAKTNPPRKQVRCDRVSPLRSLALVIESNRLSVIAPDAN